MKYLLTFGLFFLLQLNLVQAQSNGSPYQLESKKDLPLILTGLGTGITTLILGNNIAPLTLDEVNALNRESIGSFDQYATRNFSDNARRRSNQVLTAGFILPLTLLIPQKTRREFGILGLMALETALVTYSVTGLFKVSVQRIRPFVYNENVPIEEKLTNHAKQSFFSGHSSNYASLSFFMAKVISDYSNNRTIKITAWTFAATSSAYMAYLRVKAGKHFTSDVLAGYVVGAAIGILVPQWHKKTSEKLSLSPYYNFDSTGINATIRLN